MTSPLLPQQRVRVIRIIHASLMAGIIVFLLVSAWTHRARPEGAALFNAETSKQILRAFGAQDDSFARSTKQKR